MTLSKKSQNNIVYGTDSPQRTCEICGKSKPSHLMIGFVIGAPAGGHPTINHGCIQHWICSIDCMKIAAPICLQEHVINELDTLLQDAYTNMPMNEDGTISGNQPD